MQMREKFADLLFYMQNIFQYDRSNIQFVSAFYMSEIDRIQERVSDKLKNIPNFSFNLNLNEDKDDEEEEDHEIKKLELGSINDAEVLFANPMMKGFIRLNNLLQVSIFPSRANSKTEVPRLQCSPNARVQFSRSTYCKLADTTLYFIDNNFLNSKPLPCR